MFFPSALPSRLPRNLPKVSAFAKSQQEKCLTARALCCHANETVFGVKKKPQLYFLKITHTQDIIQDDMLSF